MSEQRPEWIEAAEAVAFDREVPLWVADCAGNLATSRSSAGAVEGLRRLLAIAEMRVAAETPEPERREDTAADGTVTRTGTKADGTKNKHTSGGWGTDGKFTT